MTIDTSPRLSAALPLKPTRFRPPAPVPRRRPPGALGTVLALRRNVLHIWSECDFEIPLQLRRTIVDHRALVNDPSAIRRIYVENARNYPKNELQLRLLRPALGTGLVTSNGETWRNQRHLLAPLFSPARVGAMADAMSLPVARYVDTIERRLDGADDCVLDICEEIGALTLGILEHTLFTDGLPCAPAEFQTAIARYFDTLGRLDLFDLLGVTERLPRINRLRGRKSIHFVEHMVDDMIASRRRILAEDRAVPDDMLTHLLTARDASDQRLSDRGVRDNIATFIGAGHETSANALTWTLFLLSQSPEWRARVESEIDAVPGDGFTEGALPIMRAVIDETLRLYPPISMMSRIALPDDVLAGVDIPAGTIVTIAPYVLHRHRTLWQDPDLFDPERFLEPNRAGIARHAYLPFGAGGRTCIGMGFALMEMQIVLKQLLSRFRFELVDGHPVVPHVRVTLRPQHGMKMRVHRR